MGQRTTWDFALIVHGRDVLEDAVIEELYESITDEASPARSGDTQFIDFSREATTLDQAVLTAIADVERVADIVVVGVEDHTLVTLDEIATRTGFEPDAIRGAIDRDDDVNPFPPPFEDPDAEQLVWAWIEVASWASRDCGKRPMHSNDYVFAALTDSLLARNSCRKLRADQRERIGALVATAAVPSVDRTATG